MPANSSAEAFLTESRNPPKSPQPHQHPPLSFSMHLSARPVAHLARLPRNPHLNSLLKATSTTSSARRALSTASPSTSPSPAAPRLNRPVQSLAAAAANPPSALPRPRPSASRSMSSAAVAPSAGKRLAGKTVLITGASSGIGRACAFEFALASPQDLRLVLAARRIDAIKQIADDIRKQVGDGVRIHPLQLDVSKPDEVRSFVGKLPREFSSIDILINNAGLVRGLERAPAIAEDDINVMFDTNVTGLINVTQAVLPTFLARPDGGAGDIVNIGSIAGREPYAGGSIYCATKAAVRSFSDSLRRELVHTKVRVMVVDPGQVETEFSVVRFRGDQAKADATYAGVEPLTPADIAEIVVFNVTRPQNVVIADSLVFHNAQAGAGAIHRKTS